MERIFISPIGYMRERWHQAFPDASCVSTIAELDAQDKAVFASLWMDISVIEQEFRLKSIAAACARGQPVVAMAGVPEETEAFRALNIGVQGYCHVGAASQQLLDIALVVENGGLWMPPPLIQRFLAVSTRVVPPAAPDRPVLNTLTSRELMVAEQVAQGSNNREIAQTLEITERTVKAHLTSIFEKLEVRDRVQLALKMHNVTISSNSN